MSEKWTDERTCKQCGDPYEPVKGSQKFCNRKCRTKWYRTHPEEIQPVGLYHKRCPECGNPFDTPYPFKKFDKEKCKNKYYARKKYHKDKEHNPETAQRTKERSIKNRMAWGKRKLAEGLCSRCGKNPLVYNTLCGQCYEYLKSRTPINR